MPLLSDVFRRRWRVPRGVWVLLDQAVVSSGNFGAGILLCRWLSASEFGSYGLLIETILFFNGLQAALINYPLTIRVASTDSDLRHCCAAGLGLSGLIMPLLVVAMCVAGGASSGWVVALCAVFAMVFWQVQEMLRRLLIADDRMADCVPGDMISYWGQTAGIVGLYFAGHFNLVTALLMIGATSALASVVQVAQIGVMRIGWSELLATGRDFWTLSRWSVLACLVGSAASLALMWVLRIEHGPAAVGAFVAVAALLKVSNPLLMAISSLITPGVARLARDRMNEATKFACFHGVCGLVLLAPYYLALLVRPTWVLKLIYGAHYAHPQVAWLLQCMVLYSLLVYTGGILGAWLGGLRLMRELFLAQVAQCAATAAIAAPITFVWGVSGIIIGSILAMGVGVFVSARALLSGLKSTQQRGPDAGKSDLSAIGRAA